jgi:hypothetical protein
MWKMRPVMFAVPVGGGMMRNVFVYWSNMLARFVSRAIAC